MRTIARKVVPTVLLAALAVASAVSPASAQVEVEVDPIAYVLNGHSLHVARVLGSTRLNVGTFGLQMPGSLHGNDGWDSSMWGAGIKWDYVGSSSDGFFIGLDGGYMRTEYTLESLDRTEERNVVGLGVRGGYRLPIGRSGLYLAPWMSVSYNFDGDDVLIGDERFERRSIELFPTVHIGWRF